mmetsp:Transcript_63119/g.169258  ORF Transcript_63119/g.169258 Transcript_63119/m.169258 type:complete len:204 (-) Transcript_63119:795-1406(-)
MGASSMVPPRWGMPPGTATQLVCRSATTRADCGRTRPGTRSAPRGTGTTLPYMGEKTHPVSETAAPGGSGSSNTGGPPHQLSASNQLGFPFVDKESSVLTARSARSMSSVCTAAAVVCLTSTSMRDGRRTAATLARRVDACMSATTDILLWDLALAISRSCFNVCMLASNSVRAVRSSWTSCSLRARAVAAAEAFCRWVSSSC